MIIRSSNAFFIHIPKTGGHTISNVMGGYHKNRDRKHGRHIKPEQYAKLYPDEWPSFYKFTFVRNPWDKVISYLTGLRKDGKQIREDDEYFQNYVKSIRDCIRELKNNPILNKVHMQLQTSWLLNDKGKPYKYNYIGRTENFNEDMNNILSDLGLSKREEFKRTFVSTRRRDYREYYDEETRDVVADIYKKDIEYLGYTFD